MLVVNMVVVVVMVAEVMGVMVMVIVTVAEVLVVVVVVYVLVDMVVMIEVVLEVLVTISLEVWEWEVVRVGIIFIHMPMKTKMHFVMTTMTTFVITTRLQMTTTFSVSSFHPVPFPPFPLCSEGKDFIRQRLYINHIIPTAVKIHLYLVDIFSWKLSLAM